MAPTPLTVKTVVNAGAPETVPVAADVVNGNVFPSNGTTTWIEMTNTTAIVQNVTITTPYTAGGLAIADQTVALPATANYTVKVGPFDPTLYGPNVLVNSPSATVTLACYQI